LLVTAAVAIGAFVVLKPKAPATPAPASTTTPTPPGQPTPAATVAAPASVQPAPPSASAAPATPTASAAPALSTWSVQTHPAEPLATIGTLNDQGEDGLQMQVTFNPVGAGIANLTLARHRTSIAKTAPQEVLQQTEVAQVTDASGNVIRQQKLVPMAAMVLQIGTQAVSLADDLSTSGQTLWKQTAPGAFEATILRDGQPALIVRRAYVVQAGGYHLLLNQTVENRTGEPLALRWYQLGPTDLPRTKTTYGGDLRRVRTGYLLPLAENPTGTAVYGRDILPHTTVVTRPTWTDGPVWPELSIFPSADAIERAATKPETMPMGLAWVGSASRYFSVVLHSLPDRAATRTDIPGNPKDLRLTTAERVDRVVLARGGATMADLQANAVAALRLTSPAVMVAPGATADFSTGIYAGPTSRRVLQADATAKAIGMTDLEMYTFGGPCAFCTFQPVAYFLRWFLSLLHDYLTFDWALAIILLVVCVRTLLHPVTRWSQMSLNRFGKQMQKLAPMQKQIQEKYADDPKKQREEMANLMRDSGINFSGALGCIPMFLQMPIWIALYAMIFFFFDLRHDAAFYGVIQSMTGGSWSFLADLAEPDRFIWSDAWRGFDVPLMGHVDSFNILPLILGVVFFLQQKYLTPPSATTLSPEMELQQKIMKVMIVVLFPIMMYNAPSGLAIYFITNSTLGILESKYIRKKFEEQEALREEELKKNPHKAKEASGFMAKMQQRMLDASKHAERMRAQQERMRGGR
jgi:YidC/Oxa1 family membrane protein insertase